MKAIYNWLGKHVNAPYGIYIFATLVFIEGFFVVPVSTLLAFYCLENRRKSFIYATVAALFSVIGALTGYYLGTVLWKAAGKDVINAIINPEKFEYLVEQYKTYQAWAVFITALTPMPFKLLTLTAGFCKLPLIPFLSYTLIARGIRFYFIATGIYIWGDKVSYYLNKYFYYFLILGISIFVLTIWLVH